MTNLNCFYRADSKSALSHWHLGGPDSNLKADYRANLYLNAVCYGPLSRHLSLRGSLSCHWQCHCPVTLMAPASGRVTYLTPAPGVATSSEARKARPEGR